MESLLTLLTPTTPASPWLFAVAFVAGIASVLTPCVLPMVPITLHAIGASGSASRAQRIRRSGVFALGIVTTYTTLGTIAGMTGGMASALFAHAITRVVLAAIFLALAAAAFGLWTMQLPASLRNAATRVPHGGFVGAFASGLVAGLLALPCTGPMLAALLLTIGTQGRTAFGAALLAVHAFGFALPFALIGIGLARLPARGPWPDGVKHAMGITLLVCAWWFLRTVAPTLRAPGATFTGISTALAMCASIAFALASIGAAVRIARAERIAETPTRSDRRLRRARAFGTLGAMLGSAITANALLGTQSDEWCRGEPSRPCLAMACSAHDLTVIDFGAEWCTACRTLERTTLSHPDVAAALAPHGRVSIDIDAVPDAGERFRLAGVPSVLFVNRMCHREVHRVSGYRTPEQFLEDLRTAETAVR